MRYQEQMKSMLKAFSIGYGIGFIVSLLLSLLITGGFAEGTFAAAFGFDVVFGGIISMIIMSKDKASFTTATGMVISFIKNMFGAVASALIGGSLGAVGIVIFLFACMILAIPTFVLVLYLMISYPLSIIYTVIMYFVEKAKNGIDDNVANWLDKIVPVLSVIIIVIIGIVTFKQM